MLTKLVNGLRVELTADEERAIREQWAANELISMQEEVERKIQKGRKTALMAKLNLTEQDLKDLLS